MSEHDGEIVALVIIGLLTAIDMALFLTSNHVAYLVFTMIGVVAFVIRLRMFLD
jgi:hypothetical protein